MTSHDCHVTSGELTPIGATFSTNLSSWLLAVPGSPSRRMLMSPLLVRPSGSLFREPPINRHAIAFLMSRLPYMEGEIDLGVESRDARPHPLMIGSPGNHLVDVGSGGKATELLLLLGGQGSATGSPWPIAVHLNPHHSQIWLPQSCTAHLLSTTLHIHTILTY